MSGWSMAIGSDAGLTLLNEIIAALRGQSLTSMRNQEIDLRRIPLRRPSIPNRQRIGRQNDRPKLLLRRIHAGRANQQPQVLHLRADPLVLPIQLNVVIEKPTPVADRKGMRVARIDMSATMKA